MATFAYLRVSLDSLTTDNQRKVISEAMNIDKYISETGVSGSVKAMERPEFVRMMREAKKGDTCVVTMVDRLGRTASDILNTVEEFQRREIKLRVLQFGGVDVTDSMGKMILTVMAACAELERNLLIERTVIGMARAKAQGIFAGSPLKITPEVMEGILDDRLDGMTLVELSTKYNMHRNTIQKVTLKWKNNLEGYYNEYYQRQTQYTKVAVEFNDEDGVYSESV